jgi:hypothetical protein
MDTDKNVSTAVLKDRINRTDRYTFTALDAKLLTYHDTTPGSLPERTGRTDCSTGGRVTGKTPHCDKSGR